MLSLPNFLTTALYALPAAIFAAVLLSLAMSYPEQAWICGSVFLVPLLWYIELLVASSNLSRKRFFLHSWLANFIFATLFTLFSTLFLLQADLSNWMSVPSGQTENSIIILIWFLFSLLSGTVLSVWSIGYLLLRRSDNFLSNTFVGASLWAILEYTKAWLIGLSIAGPGSLLGAHHTYYALGYLGVHVPFFKDVIAVGGIYLASFLLIAANFSIFGFFVKKERSYNLGMLVMAFLSVIIMSNVLLSLIRSGGASESVPIVIVNTNIPSAPDSVTLTDFANEVADELLAIDKKEFLAILPETIDIYGRATEERKQLLAEKRPLIISSQSSPKNPNRLFYYRPETNEIFSSDKQFLFPAGEYEMWWLGLLLGTTARPSDQRSDERLLFTNPYHVDTVVGAAICSESLSPVIHREIIKKGATFITNSTSHAAFKSSEQLERQIKAVNIARALETGRYIAVATNFNNSYVINDSGTITAELPFTGQTDHYETTIMPKQYLTPYAQFGDIVVWISLIFIILLIATRLINTKKAAI